MTLIVSMALVAEAAVLEFALRHLLTRPFYYDEAWRAYQLSIGVGIFSHLHDLPAPLALGWVIFEDVFRILFGNTEMALRAPMFLSLPLLGVATYLLARRWVGQAVSFILAAALVVNSWSVNNAFQLKSYTYEAFFAVVAIALYLRAQESTRLRTTVGWYVALGISCVCSLPNLFVVIPLLAFELLRSVRCRPLPLERIGGAGLAGMIAFAHFVLFVRPAAGAGVADTGYWVANFPSGTGLGTVMRFAGHGMWSYIALMMSGSVGAGNQPPTYHLPSYAHHILVGVLALFLLAGIAASLRVRDGRALVVGIFGSLSLELMASVLHKWPFGLVRVNIFVLPLLYILAAIGAVSIFRWLAGANRRFGPTALRQWIFTCGLGLMVGLTAASAMATGVATAHALIETKAKASQPAIFSGVRAAVALSRRTAAASDLLIIQALRQPPAWYSYNWLYYMQHYQGFTRSLVTRSRIPPQNTLSVTYVTPGDVGRFIAAHGCPQAIYLFELNGGNGVLDSQVLARDNDGVRAIGGYGYQPAQQVYYPATGLLIMLKRPDCALTTTSSHNSSDRHPTVRRG